MNYDFVTEGERLAHLVQTRLLSHIPWNKWASALILTGRSEELVELINEIAVVNLTCRIVAAGTSLLRQTSSRTKRTFDDPTFVRDYRECLRLNLLIPYELLEVFYRQSIRAVRASQEHITAKERAKLKCKALTHHAHCYMCNCALDFTEGNPITTFTLEHIWPQCYGGDSIEENLLPACGSCNSGKKGNFATWGMASVQSLILGFPPSYNELLSVEGTHRFALHNYAARRFATLRQTTLKKAFLRIGPWTDVRVVDPSDIADFFNLANDNSEQSLF